MNSLRWLLSLTVGIALVSPAFGDEKAELEKILPKWQEAWNKKDVGKLMALHHPNSRLRKAYETNPSAKEAIRAEFESTMAEYGEIQKVTPRKNPGDGQKYSVQITYRKKANASAAVALAADKDGWLIMEFDIDGGQK